MKTKIDDNARVLQSNLPSTVQPLLNILINKNTKPQQYGETMYKLGSELGQQLSAYFNSSSQSPLLVSTAEDADFLSAGVYSQLYANKINAKRVVFWNNHYQLEGARISVAPIVHSFFEKDYKQSKDMIIVKSILSGSCVVRTNILALIEDINPDRIFILAPVMHENAKGKLRTEFPEDIASKFEFLYFAEDKKRLDDGEVIPGIGGQVYQRLGIGEQPVKTGYIPKVIQEILEHRAV